MLHLKVVGDMCFHDLWKKYEEPGYLFEKIAPHLEADILAGNLECVLVPDGTEVEEEAFPKALYAHEKVADDIKAQGFDVVWLANNHMMDLGDQGILDTKRLVEARGVLTAGAGANSKEARELKIVEKEGIKVGFLAYSEDCPQLMRRRNPGPAYNRFEEMAEDVKAARDKVEVLMVVIHADVEFVDYPSLPRQEYSRELADLGADIIMEGHPHVPQGIEEWHGTLISYCQGNFIFRLGDYLKGGSPWTAQSFILDIEIAKEGVKGWDIIPYRMDNEERPIVLEGEELKEFKAHFKPLCDDLADPGKMKAHNADIVRRYLEININALAGSYERGGIEEVIQKFLPRLYMDENRFWAEEAAKMAKEYLNPWED
ncbi:CapA family protein [Planctomycetota bacterium]